MFQIKQDTLKYPNGCIQYIINEYSFNSYPILPSLPSIMIQNINICFDIQTKCAMIFGDIIITMYGIIQH